MIALAPFDGPEVDAARIGVTGHSYGGKWAMFASCLHEKFAAAVWSDGGVVFDENSPYKGKVTAYDSPIYIADAALYLMKTQPDLGIENPYALDDDQFQAAIDLLWSRLGVPPVPLTKARS